MHLSQMYADYYNHLNMHTNMLVRICIIYKHILNTLNKAQVTICTYSQPICNLPFVYISLHFFSGTVRLLIILTGFYHIKLHVFMFAMAERWIINYKCIGGGIGGDGYQSIRHMD